MMTCPRWRLPIIELTATGLASRLRQETQDLHRQSERSGFMAALLRGRLDRPGYAALLLNLQAIYAALESGLGRLPRPTAIDFTPLRRSAALARDLQDLAADTDGQALAPATQRYVQRLQELAGPQAPLLMAHAYVRYLGDLHGGQVLRQRVATLLGLAHRNGTSFYEFGPPEQVRGLILSFRAGLDAWPADDTEADALVAEARLAFQLHIELFSQLPH
jgi:heme oxygenase